MKKVLLLPLACLIVCLALFAPAPASALSWLHFTDYDVNIAVQENNVLNITETIKANFDPASYQHGIEREIPVKLDFYAGDHYIKYVPILSNIRVPGYPVKIYRSGDYQVLRIGDANKYMSGDATYTIQYTYDIGDDKIKDFDFLYFNVIGTEWNANIDHASYTVTMPKAFDAKKVWAYQGGYGSTSNSKFSVDGNVIRGQADGLTPYEGITLQVQLPEGYFTGVRTMAPFELALYIFIGVLVAVSFVLFLLFGVDKKAVETVEFYAPDHLTSAEVGYIIDGNVDNKDVVSLIIYWADKGYLQIEEKQKDVIFLKKLKDIPSDSRKYEATFFYGLFRGGDTVSVSSLKDTFYTTMSAVKTDLAASFQNKTRRIFTPVSLRMQGLVAFFTALPFAATIFYGIYKDAQEIITSFVISVIALIITLPAVYSLVKLLRAWRSTPLGKRVGKLIWRLVLLALVFLVYLFLATSLCELPGTLALVAMAATLLIAWVSVFIRKRTDQGVEWLGKIMGLQNFIEKAEKERIELLVQENPSYFYNILPFAYVLGVTEKWAKKFEQIGLKPEPPSWYTGYNSWNMFNTMMFMGMMNNSLNTMSTTMVSKPAPKGGYSSGGGGGFGGGGFSGGGFGGGGGGGW